MPAINAATCQVLPTRSPVDHGHRPVSCDTSLVVSGSVDCWSRRQNVHDKKPQHYTKDNRTLRTVHLTARSDKSVAYVTNNKRLYSTFCTVEANYWQTRSILQPHCNSTELYLFRQTLLCYVRLMSLQIHPYFVVWKMNMQMTNQFIRLFRSFHRRRIRCQFTLSHWYYQ